MKGASGLQSLRGFSMIEVLVVSSIVALALLPMIDVFRSGSRQLEQTQPYHQAVFLGEKC
ncbi:MAG: type II secretion system protein, partial [Candidatus Wallbacteria bacterium]|nr:type II secretion system protein [Candidatus Wallbacteria bacterium]